MADDKNSYQANQDVIAGARAIRSNPAAFAQLVALLNPPPYASPRADPAGALATSRSSACRLVASYIALWQARGGRAGGPDGRTVGQNRLWGRGQFQALRVRRARPRRK